MRSKEGVEGRVKEEGRRLTLLDNVLLCPSGHPLWTARSLPGAAETKHTRHISNEAF